MRLVVLSLLLLVSPARADIGAITPGDNLVVEGIPSIPKELAAEVGRYTRARAADFLDWHPQRREMLIATFFANTPQIHLVKFPGGDRTQMTFFEDRATTGVSFQPTRGEYFIFSKDTGGDQNYQNYRYDLATASITLLTDGKSRNSPGIWSTAGDRVAYSSTRRTGKDTDLYTVDPTNPASDRILAELEGGGWRALDWSPDDRQLLVSQTISINEAYLWLLDVQTGERTRIAPKEGDEKVSYSSGRFRRDGKAVYVVTDRESEFRRLASIDLTTGQHTYLTSQFPHDVSEFDPSPDGRMLAIVTNQDGFTVLHLLDARTGKEKSLKVPAASLTGVISIRWHENSRDLGFGRDSAKFPTDAYALDTRTCKLERWTFSETGGLDTRQFVEPELIRWQSFDGESISGFLYRPPARFTGPRPVIVDIHGGPEGQFQPYFLSQLNYYMNELGIALIFPNIRGSSGFGKSFLRLDNGMLRENAYQDVGALLAWIGTRSELDASRIMVTGFSYGGHMTLATATRYADRIRCAVDIVGPSNLVTFLERTAAYRQDLRRAEYGDERDPEMRAFLERTAPLHNAAKLAKPLFVVQGKNDPLVPVSEAEQIVQAARKNGVPVWYLMAEDEGHGFSKKSNSDYHFYATVMFVKQYLLK